MTRSSAQRRNRNARWVARTIPHRSIRSVIEVDGAFSSTADTSNFARSAVGVSRLVERGTMAEEVNWELAAELMNRAVPGALVRQQPVFGW